jgi:hypothetical protein
MCGKEEGPVRLRHTHQASSSTGAGIEPATSGTPPGELTGLLYPVKAKW